MVKPKLVLLGATALLVIGLGLRWPAAIPIGRPALRNSPASRLANHFPNVRLRTQDNREVRFYDDLVLELRQRYKLEAYAFRRTYDFSKPTDGLGYNRYGGPRRMRYLSNQKFD